MTIHLHLLDKGFLSCKSKMPIFFFALLFLRKFMLPPLHLKFICTNLINQKSIGESIKCLATGCFVSPLLMELLCPFILCER